MKGELSDSLLVHEFAQLRATDFKGLDHSLYAELLTEIQNRAACGQIQLETRTRYEWTGRYVVIWPYDPDKGPAHSQGEFRKVVTTSSGEPYIDHLPSGTRVEKEMRAIDEQFISEADARRLYAFDPTRWSQACVAWARINADTDEAPIVAVDEGLSRIERADREQRQKRAQAICNEHGITQTEPVKLYAALRPALEPLGYTKEQVLYYQKNPNRLPDTARLGDGRHDPVAVVLEILKKDPNRPPKPR
jgi:hypothetical protein